jgi:pyridinium-3,5-bisthiocarboxylic acid mononucleotide nickel chelatase
MRGLYLDCFSGISGDMLLGVLVDLGVDPKHLRSELGKIAVSGFSISATTVRRAGLAGTRVNVAIDGARRQPRRGPAAIRALIEKSRLPGTVRERALAAFATLVAAEARVHRIPESGVHLHEVGAVDAIVDIVGAMIGLEALGWPRVVCSPLHVGRGLVRMEHGTFPVPPPAVAEILKGRPCYATHVEGELVTPTGAALAVTLADSFGPLPSMRPQAVGYGAGSRDLGDHPNLLRGILGDLLDDGAVRETVLVLETTIDDMNPQLYGHLMERLFAAGALEVFYTPVQMKKNRPGTLATIICPEPRIEAVGAVIFRETTTIGFRYQPMGRIELGRRTDRVRTPWGEVRMKVSEYGGESVQATPEYEDCRALALEAGVPLKTVQQAALHAHAHLVKDRTPRRTPARHRRSGRGPKRRGGR